MNVIKIYLPPTSGETNQRIFLLGNQGIYQRLLNWIISCSYRLYRGSLLQHIVECFRYFFQEVLLSKKEVKPQGPNSLEELLKQFDLPKKEKTKEELIRNYQIFLTMAALEYDMLKLAPPIKFYSHNWIEYEGGKAYYDWAPCILRPEVLYCSYGKN